MTRSPNRPEATNPEQAWSNLKNLFIESVKEVCESSTGRRWSKQTWWWNERVDVAIKAKMAHFKTHRSLRKKGKTPEARAALTAYQDAKHLARHEIWLAKTSAGEIFKNIDPKGAQYTASHGRCPKETRMWLVNSLSGMTQVNPSSQNRLR